MDGGAFELVRRARRGDRAAFERLYALALPPVWRWAVRRAGGQVARAEALAERALTAAFAELDDYDGRTRFEFWLLARAHRAAAAGDPLRVPAAPASRIRPLAH